MGQRDMLILFAVLGLDYQGRSRVLCGYSDEQLGGQGPATGGRPPCDCLCRRSVWPIQCLRHVVLSFQQQALQVLDRTAWPRGGICRGTRGFRVWVSFRSESGWLVCISDQVKRRLDGWTGGRPRSCGGELLVNRSRVSWVVVVSVGGEKTTTSSSSNATNIYHISCL